jgi:hypothetical protein
MVFVVSIISHVMVLVLSIISHDAVDERPNLVMAR